MLWYLISVLFFLCVYFFFVILASVISIFFLFVVFVIFFFFFFFFQAEDGIRDGRVTGVQTCALPIYRPALPMRSVVLPRASGKRAGALLSRPMRAHQRAPDRRTRHPARALVAGVPVAAGPREVDRTAYRRRAQGAGCAGRTPVARGLPGVRGRLHRDPGGDRDPRTRNLPRRRRRGAHPDPVPQ